MIYSGDTMDIEETKKLEEKITKLFQEQFGSQYDKEQAERFFKRLDDIFKNEKPKKKEKNKKITISSTAYQGCTAYIGTRV